jgi:hypothetical protein
MPRRVSRRGLLRRAPAALGVLGGVARVPGAGATESRRERTFDPRRHAFGFRNWSTAVPTYPGHDHEAVSESEVRRVVRSEWPETLRRTLGVTLDADAEALVGSIARQLYVSANQASASNGHCYGMAYAAQAYFERPSTVPLGRSTASEFAHPEAPLGEDGNDKGPVATDVDVYQNLQLLDPNAWLGRRGLFAPGLIDLAASVRNVRAVIDRFGTAAVTLLNTTTLRSHQVLVYDARREGERTRLAVYDPNYAARHYRERGPRHLEVVHGDDGVRLAPYEGYDSFVYNERDRVVAARGRADAVPGFDARTEAVAGWALRPVVFTVVGESAEAVVVDPAGRRVRREHAGYEDLERTPVCAMRYRYGGESGTYRIAILGRDDGEYALRVDSATPSGELLRAEAGAAIGPGETHRYRAEIPGSAGETGSLRRLRPEGGVPSTLVVAGALAGVGVGAAAAAVRCRSRGSGSSASGGDANGDGGVDADADGPGREGRRVEDASPPRERD